MDEFILGHDLLTVIANDRLEHLDERLACDEGYQRVKQAYNDEAARMDDMLKEAADPYKKEFYIYTDKRSRFEQLERTEAYLQGVRDCVAVMGYLGTPDTPPNSDDPAVR